MSVVSRNASLLVLALGLFACGGGDESLNQLDNRLTSKNEIDPAIAASLEDQIMVDPALAAQANDDAIRPAREPYQSQVPAGEGRGAAGGQTLGGLAAQQAFNSRDSFNGCGLSVHYSAEYAAKLPADLPLYNGSKVIEAAGSDDNGCRLRAISASAPAELQMVGTHYVKSAKAAGYSTEVARDGKGLLISGKRAADGGAFYVVLQPGDGGTVADLVVNNGR
jgi:hypothetical protein